MMRNATSQLHQSLPPSPMPSHSTTDIAVTPHSAWEVFRCFLKLGLTSFGGPIAHLAYFRRELVERRRWLDEQQYAQLLALCQFLPGPASSQLGFSIGLLRAGFVGALAAFVAFTLPSALLMLSFALYAPLLPEAWGVVLVHGLKLVAVVVVAHAVIGMSQQLCPDWSRRVMALIAAIIMLAFNAALLQLLVIALGAVAGMWFCRDAINPLQPHFKLRYGTTVSGILLLLFFLLLMAALLPQHDVLLSAMAAFYRAGALVFGGGHVVLPLLKASTVDSGWISANEFLAGYGAAQAVPGPMFTLAAYLGAILPGSSGGVVGAAAALLMIFLPGLLLITAMLPLWGQLAMQPLAGRAIAGINAAVVGLLAAALYNPVWVSGITTLTDGLIALPALLMLQVWRLSALWVIVWCVGVRAMLAVLT